MQINLPVQSTDEEYIDIRNSARWFQRAFAKLQEHPVLSSTNKELISRFVRDASLGKTLPGRAKKKVGPARLTSYIVHLSMLCFSAKKNLDALQQEDMEAFIENLEWQRLSPMRWGIRRPLEPCNPPKPLSPRYQLDIKLTVRKFYKWLWGNNRVYPPIVEWIDTVKTMKEISALTETEIRSLIFASSRVLHRALIQVLFDGGFRMGELLNLRLRHLTYRAVEIEGSSQKCFMVRVPFSKTLRRTVVLPMPSTTELLQIWLRHHPAKPTLLPDGTIGDCDTNAVLFPVRPHTPRVILARAGKVAFNKRVYPHLLRHSSATYWCTKLPYFQFCKRFGWTMTSNMPQRYIDREGIDDLESARIYLKQNQQAEEERHAHIERRLQSFEAKTPVAVSMDSPTQRVATGMLINKHISSQTQYGGVQDDKPTISDYEGASGSQRAEQRHASGHAIHYQPAQRGQRTRRIVHGIPESHCCQTATGCTSPSQSTWSGQVQAGSTKGISPVLPAQVRQGRRYSVRSSSKPPARQCFSACCNPQ